MTRAATYVEGSAHGPYTSKYSGPQARNPRIDRLKDTRFNSFKTWSGKLERQLTQLRGNPIEPKPSIRPQDKIQGEALPVHRYFDALSGPELDTLRVSNPFYKALIPCYKFLLS